MKSHSLTYQNLSESLTKLGISKGSIVYITGDISKLGIPVDTLGHKIYSKRKIYDFYIDTIKQLLGSTGTLVFPTHSWSLVGNETIFNPSTTPTDYPLSEYIRTHHEVARQIHPFASISAIGSQKDTIIENHIQLHPYNIRSPFANLEKVNCIYLSIGMNIRYNFSPVHYCEFCCGVPYRYSKAFQKKLFIDNIITEKEFYLYSCYLNVALERNRNQKIFSDTNTTLQSIAIGKSLLETCQLNIEIKRIKEIMLVDPYIWLDSYDKTGPELPWFT